MFFDGISEALFSEIPESTVVKCRVLLNMRYGFDEISSSFFNWTVALVVALFVVTLHIYYYNGA